MITPLTFNRLRDTNVGRCEEVFHPLLSWSPAEWAVAMAGECGEVCNVVKKLRRLQDGTNTAKDPQTFQECKDLIAAELADTVIYADLLAARLCIDLGDAIKSKFNVVSDRMQSSYRL